jgi:hypothetical protein
MTVTQQEVDAARKAADDAEAASKKAHDDADAAKKAAEAAKTKAVADRAAADEAAGKVKPLNDEAGRLEGVSGASGQACTDAQAATARARQAVKTEEGKAARVQAKTPGESNADTEAANQRVEAAKKRLSAAQAKQKKVCAQAEADRKAAEAKRAEANAAVAEAEKTDKTADESETAADKANGAHTNAVADARTAAMNASVLRGVATNKSKELEGQANAAKAGPQSPNVPDSCGAGGVQTPAPPDGGCHSSTRDNVFIEVKGNIIHLFGKDESKTVRGKLGQNVTGFKCTNVLGGEATFVVGGRWDVVIGAETKLVALGDFREISGNRWERNIGLKVEQVKGDVEETLMDGQLQHVPTVNSTIQPTKQVDSTPKAEELVNKYMEKHKGKLADLRKQVKENYKKALEHYDSVKSRMKEYSEDTKKIEAQVQDLIVRAATLKTEAKKYQMKSDAFIKILVNGTAKRKAGRYKDSPNAQYIMCANAIATLQGEVKWN